MIFGILQMTEQPTSKSFVPRPCRARDLGIAPGIFPPGPMNAITDVAGVRVGHVTCIEGDDIRTGATAVLPHGGNLFRDRVPAGIAVGNGFGKLMGYTQVSELGELETPIVLTNTLAVPRAADAILDWTLACPGNEEVTSVNPVVGEINDSWLNNIRSRVLTAEIIRRAIDSAQPGMFAQGSVGAGTGAVALGWKGGIGTSSRLLPPSAGGYRVGVLVVSNFGGTLQVMGVRVEGPPGRDSLEEAQANTGGSIIMVVATDAPVGDRNLTRLARRALAGLARTGSSMSNESGDYAIAFSTSDAVRRSLDHPDRIPARSELANRELSPLFQQCC